MRSLDDFAHGKLLELESSHLRRRIIDTTPRDGVTVERDGRRLISFSSNDYLNFTQHPAVKAAALEAIQRSVRSYRGTGPTQPFCVFRDGGICPIRVVQMVRFRAGSAHD